MLAIFSGDSAHVSALCMGCGQRLSQGGHITKSKINQHNHLWPGGGGGGGGGRMYFQTLRYSVAIMYMCT